MYGNNRYGDGPRAPVSVGDELNVTIEAVGEKGDGIAKKNGFVLFVPNVKEGDNVKIKVNKVLKKVGFADVVGKAEESGQEAEEEPEDAGQDSQEISEEEMANDSEDFGEESSEAEDIEEPEDNQKSAYDEELDDTGKESSETEDIEEPDDSQEPSDEEKQ
ncbi:MAG: TRAM domain-containing protein [Candidatus Nanoarchaeia archaeon]